MGAITGAIMAITSTTAIIIAAAGITATIIAAGTITAVGIGVTAITTGPMAGRRLVASLSVQCGTAHRTLGRGACEFESFQQLDGILVRLFM